MKLLGLDIKRARKTNDAVSDKKAKTTSNDSAMPYRPFHGSSYKNLATGQGTERDHRNHGVFVERDIPYIELEAMYEHNGLAGRSIDLPVDEMLKNWRDFDDKYKSQIKAAEKKANYKRLVSDWAKTGDVYGGSVFIPLIYGQDDLEQPLDMNRIRKGDVFRWLIFDPETIGKHLENYVDPTQENYMQPEYYILPTEAGSLHVHPSRCFEYSSIKRPMRKRLLGGFHLWPQPRLARYYDAIQTYEEVMGSTAQLVTSANIDVITEEGLSDALTTEAEESLFSRATIMNHLKSVFGMMVLDKEAQYSRNSVSLSGLAPTLEIAQEDVCNVTGIPATLLFGKAKAGMSGDTNDGDIRNFNSMLEHRQEELSEYLAGPDEVMIRNALGYMPDDIDYTWNPIAVVTGSEAAKIEKDLASAAKDRIDSGQVSPEEVHDALENNSNYKLNNASFAEFTKKKQEQDKPGETDDANTD